MPHAPLPILRHCLAAATFAALLVFWYRADYFGNELIAEIAIFAILAMSLDLVAGATGMVSLGHAALFGTGAYLYALLSVVWGWPAGIAMPAACLATGVLSFIVAMVVTRVEGIFFIMITLAMGEMAHEFFFKNKTLGGDDGFGDIVRLDLARVRDRSQRSVDFRAGVAADRRRDLSIPGAPDGFTFRYGLTRLARQCPAIARLGIAGARYQRGVFALSGLLAGIAGTLSAQHTMYISPQLLSWTTSGEVLVMIIVGGLGTHDWSRHRRRGLGVVAARTQRCHPLLGLLAGLVLDPDGGRRAQRSRRLVRLAVGPSSQTGQRDQAEDDDAAR